MDKQNELALLEQNYKQITNFLGYDYAVSIRIPLAVQYTFSRETFSGVAFEKIVKELQKGDTKKFFTESLLTLSKTSTLSYKLAAHLALHATPYEEATRLLTNDGYLLQEGFKKSPYNKIASIFLTDAAHAQRAKKLHEEMRKHHYFLTGKDDIPYAVLLTKENTNIKLQAQTMRDYYDQLAQRGFKIGDSLQATTQLLTLYNEQFQPMLVDYIVALQEKLISFEITIKKRHYPYLAVLALTGATTDVVAEIAVLFKQLSALKMFKGEKEYIIMTAIQFIIRDMMEAGQLVHLTDISLIMRAVEANGLLMDFTFSFGIELLDFLN